MRRSLQDGGVLRKSTSKKNALEEEIEEVWRKRNSN
jgi:hypothetical protein